VSDGVIGVGIDRTDDFRAFPGSTRDQPSSVLLRRLRAGLAPYWWNCRRSPVSDRRLSMFSRGPDHPMWTRRGDAGGGWRRSTHCGTSTECYSSNCVEVSVDRDEVRLRDSAAVVGPVLAFPAHAWAAFVDEAKRGRFD
jgi:hypothetical protein